jgi:PAS domain S-box-containing protein
METTTIAGLPAAPVVLPALLALLPSGVVYYTPVYDAAGTVVDFCFAYLNPAAQHLLGLPAQPAQTYFEQWPDSVTNGAFAWLRDIFLVGTPARLDEYYYNTTQEKFIQAHGCRLEGGVLVSFTDGTDQPRTAVEDALRQSRAREQQARAEAEREKENLLRVFEQATVAMALFQGPDYTIELANAEMANIWGRSPSQIVGRPVFEALPDIMGQGFEAIFADVLTHGTPYDLQEVPVTIARGHTDRPTLGYFNLTYQPQHDAQGRITGIVTLAIEVTERVLAHRQLEAQTRQTNQLNQELQMANAEIGASNATLMRIQRQLRAFNDELEVRVQERTQSLRESQAREQAARQAAEVQQQNLRDIFEQAPVAICLMRGPQAVVELLNKKGAVLVGSTPAQVVGQPIRQALPVLNGQGFEALYARVMQGETLVFQEMPIAFDRTATGQPNHGYYHHTYQPWRDEQGTIVGVINIGVEVTEQVLARRQVQQLNEELRATNNQLMRTNVDLDNFIYSASHDLKAPISNIEGLLQLLDHLLPAPARADAQVAPVLAMMQGAVERFKRTITHLTDVTKLQMEFGQPPAAVPLAAVVEDVRQDLLPLLRETGGQLDVELNNCLPLVFSEKNLRLVVYNLLSNALKYRHPDRPPRVLFTCTCEENRQLLRVQDNGLGLSSAQQARLFGLFQRMHSHVEGTGIGLYMVKKIVENAGGTLSVESELGEGTTFTLSLPTQAGC